MNDNPAQCHSYHETNSQRTKGAASHSTGTKEEEDNFDLSFDEEFYLDLQKVELLD